MTRLEIVPDRLQVEADATFSLLTRGFDAEGILVRATDSRPIDWPIPTSSPVVKTYQVDNDAWFKAAQVAGVGVPLTARMDLAQAQAAVTVHVRADSDLNDSDPDDWILAPHQPDAPVSIAIVRGDRGGVPVHDEVVALAGAARLTNLTGPGTLALLAHDSRVLFQPVDWTPEPDTTHTARAPSWQVPLRIWDATTAGLDPASFLDLQTANLVFRLNRTGVEFTMPNGVERLSPFQGSEAACAQPELTVGSAFNPAVMEYHVFYVDAIAGGWLGVTCPVDAGPARPAQLSFVSVLRSGTTLAHEMGHAMGLRNEDGEGHTDCIAGFAGDNLMWAFASDGQVNRLRLSLGQVYRVAIDQRSWLVKLGWGAAAAPPICSDPTSNCPALALAATVPPVAPHPSYCGAP